METTTILLLYPKNYPAQLRNQSSQTLERINDELKKLLKTHPDMTYQEFLSHLKLSEQSYIAAIRSGIHRPTVFLKRRLKDAFTNAYNIHIAKSWQANMDIQFILDPHACTKYCAAYVSKSCRGMSELMKQVVEEVKSKTFTSLEKLKKFGHVFLNGSEVSSQEAGYTNLGLPFSKCSRDCVFINTGVPLERVVIAKSKYELEALPSDSVDITVKGMLDHYTQRPNELSSLTLAEFAAWWTYSKKITQSKKQSDIIDEDINVCARVEDINQTVNFPLLDGSGFVRKRQLARIIRYRNFGSLVDPLNYYKYNFASFFQNDKHNAI